MWNLILPAVTPIVDKLVGLIPNSNDRAKAKEEFELELQRAVTRASEMQVEVNKVEAAHKSVFVAGWRPFIGWICGLGIAWAFLIQPTVIWYVAAFHPEITNIPKIDTDGLFALVLAMLGMGGLRTFEKTKKVSREQ